MQRFIHYGYWALAVGGVMLAAGSGWTATLGGPLSEVAPTTGFTIGASLRLVGAIAIMIGLTAVYTAIADRAGWFGIVAYTLALSNMVLQAGWIWADTFLSGMVAEVAPGILDGETSDGRATAGFMLAWLMNTTLALLGIAVLRARQHRRAVGWGLIVMGAITLVPLPIDGPIYEVIIGLAAAVAGASALRPRAPLGAASGTLPVTAPEAAPDGAAPGL